MIVTIKNERELWTSKSNLRQCFPRPSINNTVTRDGPSKHPGRVAKTILNEQATICFNLLCSNFLAFPCRFPIDLNIITTSLMTQGLGCLIGFLFHGMKQMFFYNAVKLWNNVSENALVHSSDVKKFKRNFFVLVMCKFKPDNFKIDRIF